MSALIAAPRTALATANPWSLVPPLGNLDAYISAANRLPMLTLEEEQEYARKFKNDNDLEAAGKLVLSHLRLVVSVARQYLGYGLPHGDLIQEGNVGLMKAVKRFDPEQGVRLVSYALHWIKAEIHEYILKNWRMVKVATTKAQRKLFFNLRSMKQGMKAEADEATGTHRDTLTASQIDSMAKDLNVKREEVMEMERRLSGGEVPDDEDDAPLADAVIDACDQLRAKVSMAHWALQNKIGFVSVGAAGGKRLAHLVDVQDLSRITHDPLLAQLRYRLRKHHGGARDGKLMGVQGIFSRESVAPPDASCLLEGDGSLNCHGYGSVVSVTATFGMCAASVILNFLATSLEKP